MTRDQAKQIYWRIVTDCLVEIFGWAAQTACDAVTTLRDRVETGPREEAEFFYHAEPLNVAIDIVGGPVYDQRSQQTYDRILARFEWNPTGALRQTSRSERR